MMLISAVYSPALRLHNRILLLTNGRTKQVAKCQAHSANDTHKVCEYNPLPPLSDYTLVKPLAFPP